MGKQSFGAAVGEEFHLRGCLSRPAYAFLVVFRADGRDEALHPRDADEPPRKTDAPAYPAGQRDGRYVLKQGLGLWLVALVASDEPLPGYRAWRTGHPGSPWKPGPGKSGRVWHDNGRFLEAVDSNEAPVHGSRGCMNAAGRGPVVRVVDWLRAEGNATASAVAFTVQARP